MRVVSFSHGEEARTHTWLFNHVISLLLRDRFSYVLYIIRACDKDRPGSIVSFKQEDESRKGRDNCRDEKSTVLRGRQLPLSILHRVSLYPAALSVGWGGKHGIAFLTRQPLWSCPAFARLHRSVLFIKDRKSTHHTQISANSPRGRVPVTFIFAPPTCSSVHLLSHLQYPYMPHLLLPNFWSLFSLRSSSKALPHCFHYHREEL